MVRVVLRTCTLLWTVAQAMLDFLWLRWKQGSNVSARQRAQWLHRWCAKGLPRLGIHFTTQGPPPSGGLLVANHLSYLDILIFSAITPCVFVSKHEVAGWPIFGWMSRMAGTIFVDRSRPGETRSAQDGMQARLAEGLTVVLFPEGTSSDGTTVLPFRSSLFQAAIAVGAAISAARISYQASEGRVETDVCYWGEMTLAPHVLKLFSKARVTGDVQFSDQRYRFNDRKEAARKMYEEVLALAEKSRVASVV